MRLIFWLLLTATSLPAAETFKYWIQACSEEISRETACAARDAEMAEWALAAWKQAAGTNLSFAAAAEDRARIRVYWASGRMRLYGEARPILVGGKPGAAIYVNPDVSQLGAEIAEAAARDRLLRDAIVYLTCLHESGHALGLPHTANFEDIMYSFGYGGDIVEYFERYRRKLAAREDIRGHSGISPADRERLADLFGKRP